MLFYLNVIFSRIFAIVFGFVFSYFPIKFYQISNRLQNWHHSLLFEFQFCLGTRTLTCTLAHTETQSHNITDSERDRESFQNSTYELHSKKEAIYCFVIFALTTKLQSKHTFQFNSKRRARNSSCRINLKPKTEKLGEHLVLRR